MLVKLVVRGRVELPTFRFSGGAYAELRLDVLVVRGCLGLRQGADGCRCCRHGCRQKCLADLPPPRRGVKLARTFTQAHLPGSVRWR